MELARSIAQYHQPAESDCIAIAQAITSTLSFNKAKRQLLVDVSATCRNDLKSGIQRVVRALVWELIGIPPPGYRIEPVYLSDEGGRWHYRYARAWTSASMGLPVGWMADDPVAYADGDFLLMADLATGLVLEIKRAGLFEYLKLHGVKVYFVVYDLLPIQMPMFFPPEQFGFVPWLDALTSVADGAVCISQAVSEDLKSWVDTFGKPRSVPLNIEWFHLGADIYNSLPTSGLLTNTAQVLSRLAAVPSFLMVGTIEPRKGYLQTLEAFTQLWQEGCEINLVIVGKEGWQGLPENMRRTIPEMISQLRNHPELGKHLIWLEGISDEYLEKVYAASHCLIAASEGEGFGLPLIEAAQHKLSIIARDIPVFREVAGIHAYYFSGLAPTQLSASITSWLELFKNNLAPSSVQMPWLTWKQSAEGLVKKLNLSY